MQDLQLEARARDYIMVKSILKHRMADRYRSWKSRMWQVCRHCQNFFIHLFHLHTAQTISIQVSSLESDRNSMFCCLFIFSGVSLMLPFSSQLLKQEHVFGGIIYRPVFSSFTRPRRITCLFIVVLGNITLNTLFLGREGFDVNAKIAAGVVSAFVMFPIGLLFSAAFRSVDSG